MENNIDYKRLYELSIIEKEKILVDNQAKLAKIKELTEENKKIILTFIASKYFRFNNKK